MAEEEEVRLEVEAVQAVYGDDCWVIEDFPPHLNVHIRPRTADDSSQQFVEVILGIKSGAQYPKEPPHVYIVEPKGLDEKRRAHLITSIENKAWELSSCLMLVALCEEAVEILSNMNHPDGHCPLCLYPFVRDDTPGAFLPFMKLMSCYHCFHSECIIRWWKWLQEQNKNNEMNPFHETSFVSTGSHRGMHTVKNQHMGNCPVCRKVFDAKDIEHVLDYLERDSSQLTLAGTDTDKDMKEFLQSVSENCRRQKFEGLLKLQQENSGLIEPRKDLVILPGMFLPETVMSRTMSTETSDEQCGVTTSNPTVEMNPNNSSKEQCGHTTSNPTVEMNPNNSSNKATASKHKNSSTKRSNRAHSSRRQPHAQSSRKQWIKKEKDALEQ